MDCQAGEHDVKRVVGEGKPLHDSEAIPSMSICTDSTDLLLCSIMGQGIVNTIDVQYAPRIGVYVPAGPLYSIISGGVYVKSNVSAVRRSASSWPGILW